MKRIWMASTVVAITLAAGVAAAQTPPPAPGGAFESLSPGNQKIARAIFDSEQRVGSSSSTKPLSLDEIAKMKQSGTGWGAIFNGMKSQGLVQDRNLGQAVSRNSLGGGGSSLTRTEITTASGKTVMVGGHEGSNAAGASGTRGIGSDDARGDAGTSAAVGHGRGGSNGASSVRGGVGSHGGGRGR
jgi:hypothetical protein